MGIGVDGEAETAEGLLPAGRKFQTAVADRRGVAVAELIPEKEIFRE